MIAQTIIAQLGGNKFIAMTGSKNFLAYQDGLRFDLVKNISGAKRCHITLYAATDTYGIHFYKLNKKSFALQTIAQFEDVYFDQLQDIFTTVTGLYTSLGTITKN